MIKLPDEKERKFVYHGGTGAFDFGYEAGWNECLAEVQRLNTAAQPVSDGWVLVPIEPTEGMLATGSATDGGLYCIWKDMLAAAPGGQDD